MRDSMEISNESVDVGRMEQEDIVDGVSLVGIGIIKTMAALIGVWGLACLIGGVAKSGGLMEMAQAWLTAVTGM